MKARRVGWRGDRIQNIVEMTGLVQRSLVVMKRDEEDKYYMQKNRKKDRIVGDQIKKGKY